MVPETPTVRMGRMDPEIPTVLEALAFQASAPLLCCWTAASAP